MLGGSIGGVIIGLGYWYLFRYGGKRYWSIGLTVLLAGAGWIGGMQKAPSVNSMWGMALGFAIVMAVVGLFVGLMIDLWRYFYSPSALSDDQKGASRTPSNGNGSNRGDAAHELLGVSPDAGPEEITAAYQAMMQKHQRQSGTASLPSLPSAPHQEQSRSTTDHGSKTALNLALFLGVPIAVVLGVVWLGSKSSTAGSSPRIAPQSSALSADECYSLIAAENYQAALGLCREAAEQGYASAQTNLGWLYYNGYGVPKDYAQAVKWYGLAAEQSDATAQYNLGLMYDNGRGVSEDDDEAAKWYRLAADQGDADAKARLEELTAGQTKENLMKSWTGRYEGTLFGDAAANMHVSQTGDRLNFDLFMEGERCGGGFEQTATPTNPDSIVVTMPYDSDSGLQCKVQINRKSFGIEIKELSACHMHHGFECGFEGTLFKE